MEINEATIAQFKTDFARVRAECGKVIVGNTDIVDGVLICLLSGGHALLEGVPGLGKTLLVRTLSRVLDLDFNRVQFTPDLMPADITGTNILMEDDSGRKIFQFQPGPVFANIVLADEINRATPKTQSALLEAMGEGQVSESGVTHTLAQPFVVVATQNPIEFEGTYRLPEAQLDRFLLRLSVGYPSEAQEAQMLARLQECHPIDTLRPVAAPDELMQARGRVRGVRVESELRRYIAAITARSRVHPQVALGGGPRASLAIQGVAQALAYLDDRAFVSPADIKAAAPGVLGHRLSLHTEARLTGVQPESVVAQVLAEVPVPVEVQG